MTDSQSNPTGGPSEGIHRKYKSQPWQAVDAMHEVLLILTSNVDIFRRHMVHCDLLIFEQIMMVISDFPNPSAMLHAAIYPKSQIISAASPAVEYLSWNDPLTIFASASSCSAVVMQISTETDTRLVAWAPLGL